MSTKLVGIFGQQGAPTRGLVEKLWRRLVLRKIGQNDNHAALDELYALPDPWRMDTAREQSRFAQTNTLIRQLCGPVRTLLEVGSGEGHQSEHLQQVTERLDGIDVSDRAVLRARARLPRARFGTGSLQALPFEQPAGGYDLVVACEVLYYMSDIPAALQSMSALGQACLVTFFAPSARVVAPHLLNWPQAQRGWIYHDPYAWLWVYWRNQDAPAA